MDQKPIAKKPLLYINQPTIKESLGQMQSSFTFSAEKPAPKPPEKETVPVQAKERKKTVREEPPLSYNEPVKNTSPQQPSQGLKPVKSFPNMTIDEKLDYIFSSPQFYYCSFQTNDSEFVGKIKELHQENLTVMTTKGSLKRIERDELVGIRIIG